MAGERARAGERPHLLPLATAGDTLDLGSWKPTPAGGASPGRPRPAGSVGTLAEAERAQVLKALEATGWNITHASDLLGISRPTLRKKIAVCKIREGRPE
jgi:transcriptional regulator of acetoin/glycerol metabolism